jgi:RHS repeat-associated protein
LLADGGTYSYTYDNEGNRTSRTNIATGEVTQYAWDYHNRLTSVITKDSSGTVTKSVAYTYDAYDRRIAKNIDPDGAGAAPIQTERMVYDGDNIALTFDGNGTQTHRYLHGPRVDEILADETTTGVNWALTDNQGTVRHVIDSQGQVLNHIVYDSYGQVTSETNPNVDFRYGYTGRERDEETGLNYYRARYFDAAVGRFISEDPIGFRAGDSDLYRYVGNNPINLIDPLGLDGEVVIQKREIVLSNGDKYVDFGSTQYYRPSGWTWGGWPKWGGSEPELKGNTISQDTTNAWIRYKSQKNGLTAPKAEPWGGFYTPPSKAKREAAGHIIPNILGGSNTDRGNFMSQNRSVNSGGYKQFGKNVNDYLNGLGRIYEEDKKVYDEIVKKGVSCPVGPPPKVPSVGLTVELKHFKKTTSNSNFPFRPDQIKAKAVFNNGKIIEGIFSNNPTDKSEPGFTWRMW